MGRWPCFPNQNGAQGLEIAPYHMKGVGALRTSSRRSKITRELCLAEESASPRIYIKEDEGTSQFPQAREPPTFFQNVRIWSHCPIPRRLGSLERLAAYLNQVARDAYLLKQGSIASQLALWLAPVALQPPTPYHAGPARKSTLTQQQKNQKRQRATQDQLITLEVEFHKKPTPTAAVRERIAQDSSITERSVHVCKDQAAGKDGNSIANSMRAYLATQEFQNGKTSARDFYGPLDQISGINDPNTEDLQASTLQA
ncbi:MAG: hypothetical protein Q9186_000603 [Xanthomendoza sp. 1 TL-2023]